MMNEFDLNKKPLVKNDLIEIVENYKVLHFDEFPILYIGTNKLGNKVIGSHLEEDDETKTILTLHTILSSKEFYQFINGKASYLEILKQSSSICIVEKDYNFKIRKAYDIDFHSIPPDYLPLEDSYCPATVRAHSLVFSISLKGKLADINKAVADEVSKVQNGFTEFLEERIYALEGLNLIPQAMLQPYAEGSFKINFELDLQQKDKKGNLFLQQAPLDKYIATYIKYVSENFADDREVFKNDGIDTSHNLKVLEDVMMEVYEKSYIKKPENASTILKKDILKSVNDFEKVAVQVGDSFESISIVNVVGNDETPLAFIDKEFSESFQNSIEEIEIHKLGVTVDEEFKDYKVYIYHLNTDTRIGNAFIRNSNNEEEMSKPKVKINGEGALDHTKYTESLYLSKWINVKAKAKKVGEKFKQLDIDYEE
jgi:hypothetical protein